MVNTGASMSLWTIDVSTRMICDVEPICTVTFICVYIFHVYVFPGQPIWSGVHRIPFQIFWPCKGFPQYDLTP